MRLYLSDQDVESLRNEYEKHFELETNEIDQEKTFDDDGFIIGIRFNKCDIHGNIITGYQVTYGVYGDDFGPVDMQDGEGGSKHVWKREDIPQLTD